MESSTLDGVSSSGASLYQRLQMDLLGYLGPGLLAYLLLEISYFQDNAHVPLALWKTTVDGSAWAAIALLFVGYTFGRISHDVLSVVLRRIPGLSWTSVYEKALYSSSFAITAELLNRKFPHLYPKVEMGDQGVLDEATQERYLDYLHHQGERILLVRYPAIYWKYVDRPNAVRLLSQTTAGSFFLCSIAIAATGKWQLLSLSLIVFITSTVSLLYWRVDQGVRKSRSLAAGLLLDAWDESARSEHSVVDEASTEPDAESNA